MSGVSVRGLLRACIAPFVAACVLASPAVAFYDTTGINGIASTLAGRKVSVHCLTKQEAAADFTIVMGASAYVEGIMVHGRWYPKDYAVFDHGICEALIAWAAGDASGFTVDELVWAAIVITHESGHLKGAKWSLDEAKTQCWALQHLRSTLHQLEVRDPKIVSFALAWALWIQKDMPEQYQVPKGCILPIP